MSTVGSTVISPIAADVTITSQSLAVASALAIVLTANQKAIVEAVLFFSLPANHGGVALNWLIGLSWPFSRIRNDWEVTEPGAEPISYPVPTNGINDPTRNDTVVVARPDFRARIIKVRGSAIFQAPAAGGTINVQGALAGAGANVILQAGSAVQGFLY